MLVDGEMKPIVKHKTFFGEYHTAVLAASETPQHAQSNIRKVLAYKKVLLRRNRVNSMSRQAERRATFFTLGKELYRTFYLN